MRFLLVVMRRFFLLYSDVSIVMSQWVRGCRYAPGAEAAKTVLIPAASSATFVIDVIKEFYLNGDFAHGVTDLDLNQKTKPAHRMYVIIADANIAMENS